MDAEFWEELEEEVLEILEPRIFTVRDERTFEVTHISPGAPEWSQLRQFKQLLVVGTIRDEWVAPVLALQEADLPELPALIDGRSVWARGQQVTALVLPVGGGAADILGLLPALHDRLDAQYRSYVLERMFVSGRNVALGEQLRTEAGFELLLPEVYRWVHDDSVYIFRNDWPTPADLTRSILVTWQAGVDELPAVEQALTRRERLAETHYPWEQVTERERIDTRILEGFGAAAVEFQGIWSSPPGRWPAAGPFFTRVVVCPQQDRTYLLDAWLYAPGKDKYEYVLQLQTILDSFRCAGSGQAPS